MNGRKERITQILTQKFAPLKLEVIDESHRHAAHGKDHPDAEHDDKGETHFKVIIVSEAFNDINRIDRQRAIHDALTSEFKAGLHALTMKVKSPQEDSH